MSKSGDDASGKQLEASQCQPKPLGVHNHVPSDHAPFIDAGTIPITAPGSSLLLSEYLFEGQIPKFGLVQSILHLSRLKRKWLEPTREVCIV